MRATIDPKFLGFMLETASNQQHAMAGRPPRKSHQVTPDQCRLTSWRRGGLFWLRAK
jgi:hypothetical protein